MRYGEKIEKLINERGTSQRALSKLVGTSPATMGRWVSGEQFPRLDHAIKLAHYFGVSLDDMVNDEVAEPGKAGAAALDEDERTILRVCRASGLDPDQALEAIIKGSKAITKTLEAAANPSRGSEGAAPQAGTGNGSAHPKHRKA